MGWLRLLGIWSFKGKRGLVGLVVRGAKIWPKRYVNNDNEFFGKVEGVG